MKLNDYMRGRNEGMQFALKIIEEKGIDALREECKFRPATNLPSSVSRDAYSKVIDNVVNRVTDVVLLLASATLRDEFGFGQSRLIRFKNRFELKVDCINDNFVTYGDLQEDLLNDANIKLELRRIM